MTTAKGTINARTAIVTVPTNVIASGGLTIHARSRASSVSTPSDALSLGSYDHIALELVGNPLGLDSDDLVFEKSNDTHTAALLANISGTPLCVIDVAGSFGHDLSAQGEAAMFAFASRLARRASTAPRSKTPSAAKLRRAGTAIPIRSAPGRPRCRAANSRAANCSVRSPAMSGMPAKPRMKHCGARSAAPGNPANAPPTPRCARLGPLRPTARREAAPKRKPQRARAEARARPRTRDAAAISSAARRTSCARSGDSHSHGQGPSLSMLSPSCDEGACADKFVSGSAAACTMGDLQCADSRQHRR